MAKQDSTHAPIRALADQIDRLDRHVDRLRQQLADAQQHQAGDTRGAVRVTLTPVEAEAVAYELAVQFACEFTATAERTAERITGPDAILAVAEHRHMVSRWTRRLDRLYWGTPPGSIRLELTAADADRLEDELVETAIDMLLHPSSDAGRERGMLRLKLACRLQHARIPPNAGA